MAPHTADRLLLLLIATCKGDTRRNPLGVSTTGLTTVTTEVMSRVPTTVQNSLPTNVPSTIGEVASGKETTKSSGVNAIIPNEEQIVAGHGGENLTSLTTRISVGGLGIFCEKATCMKVIFYESPGNMCSSHHEIGLCNEDLCCKWSQEGGNDNVYEGRPEINWPYESQPEVNLFFLLSILF